MNHEKALTWMGWDQGNGDWQGVVSSSIENDIIIGRNFMTKVDGLCLA
jgi:hypothetical protein